MSDSFILMILRRFRVRICFGSGNWILFVFFEKCCMLGQCSLYLLMTLLQISGQHEHRVNQSREQKWLIKNILAQLIGFCGVVLYQNPAKKRQQHTANGRFKHLNVINDNLLMFHFVKKSVLYVGFFFSFDQITCYEI